VSIRSLSFTANVIVTVTVTILSLLITDKRFNQYELVPYYEALMTEYCISIDSYTLISLSACDNEVTVITLSLSDTVSDSDTDSA